MPQKHAKNNCASKCFNHWERNEASSEGHYGTRKARIEEIALIVPGARRVGGGGGGMKDGRQVGAMPVFPGTATTVS